MSFPLLVYIVENLSYSGVFFMPIFIIAGLVGGFFHILIISGAIGNEITFLKDGLRVEVNPESFPEEFLTENFTRERLKEPVEVDMYSTYFYLRQGGWRSRPIKKSDHATISCIFPGRESPHHSFSKLSKVLIALSIVSIVLHTFLPTKRTVYLMAGAYMVEQVIDSPEAKEIGALSYSIVKNQLILWAESEKEIAPQLKSMVETLDKSAGLSQQ